MGSRSCLIYECRKEMIFMGGIKIGDKVIMNDRYCVSNQNKGKVWTVCSEPWRCCGTLVVKLEGISGCYAADGLEVINHDGAEGNTQQHRKADAERA